MTKKSEPEYTKNGGYEKVTTDNGFDEFLNDATLKVREMWEDRGGAKIGEHEAQALNDALETFFADQRRQQ